MRWLALDLGKRRVGVALCNAEETVTTPLPPFPFARLLEQVRALVEEYGVEGIVVGVPITRDGASRGEARAAEAVSRLEALGLPVEREDERGTTAAAAAFLRQTGRAKRRWEEGLDSVAAQLILDSFLGRRRGGAPAPPGPS